MVIGQCRIKGTMRHYFHILVALGILAYPAVGQTACFETLGAINSAMQTELTRIQNGAAPQDSYTYTLCPNKFYDASMVILSPKLNNAMFICGEDGSRTNNCVILGGTEQVRIVDSEVSSYPLQELSFTGITFSGFEGNTRMTGTSIAALASSAATVTFTDCSWQDFTSDFVILQNAEDSFFGPMTVQVARSAVSSGSAGAIFDNDGGLLRISQIEVTDVSTAALVATANNGASFLEQATVSRSNINAITYTTAGGSQTVISTTVTQMSFMENTFYVEDIGSTLLLEGLVLEQNDEQTIPWSAVSVKTEAITRISESSISDNTAVEFGVVAINSIVTIEDSFISRNTGLVSQNRTSAPIFAITDANVNMDRVELNDNKGFSGSVVALIRSTTRINKSCFEGGNSQYVVFIASDSSYEQSENFIDNYSSQRCETTGPRLFKENSGSGCFMGNSRCEGTCQILADQTECRAQQVPTQSPATSAPISIPTFTPPVPTVSPVSRAPTGRPSLGPLGDPTLSPPTSFETQTPSTDMPSLKPTPRPTDPPTGAPTVTASPTISAAPSLSPTISSQPSISAAPTTTKGGGDSKEMKSKGKGSKASKESKPDKGGKSKKPKKGMKGMTKKSSNRSSSTRSSKIVTKPSASIGDSSKSPDSESSASKNDTAQGKGKGKAVFGGMRRWKGKDSSTTGDADVASGVDMKVIDEQGIDVKLDGSGGVDVVLGPGDRRRR